MNKRQRKKKEKQYYKEYYNGSSLQKLAMSLLRHPTKTDIVRDMAKRNGWTIHNIEFQHF